MPSQPIHSERETPLNPPSNGSAGQFAMHPNPPSVWPDFMVGQTDHPRGSAGG